MQILAGRSGGFPFFKNFPVSLHQSSQSLEREFSLTADGKNDSIPIVAQLENLATYVKAASSCPEITTPAHRAPLPHSRKKDPRASLT